jgi:hypothetical protein
MENNTSVSERTIGGYVEHYEIKEAERHLSIVRYLIECADNKSLTHGEKHHLMQVALAEIGYVFENLHSDQGNSLIRTDIVHTPEPHDIPF